MESRGAGTKAYCSKHANHRHYILCTAGVVAGRRFSRHSCGTAPAGYCACISMPQLTAGSIRARYKSYNCVLILKLRA